MQKDLVSILQVLEVEDEPLVGLQRVIVNLGGNIDDAFALANKIKMNIQMSSDNGQLHELPFFYLFLSYCYHQANSLDDAIKAASSSIEKARTYGMDWVQAVGHWFLSLIYREKGQTYLYRDELSKALKIAINVRSEHRIRGKYSRYENCAKAIRKIEEEYAYATEDIHTDTLLKATDYSESPQTVDVSSNDHVNLVWIPIYQSVRAGPTGMVWVDPPKEDVAWVSTISIHGKSHRLHSLKKTSPTDQQITIVRDLPYGLAQVTGNSMNAHEPVSIDDKDYILFQRTTNSQNGDIVVASRPIQSSGEDAYMVKKYNKIDQLLVSETNDTLSPYPDVKLNKDHQILGIVIAVAKPV